MAMMDVPRAARAIREVGRVLRRGGRFVFSIPHPCFDTVFHGGKMVSGWVRRGGVPHVGEALHFRVDDYFRTGPFRASWTLRGTDHTFVSEGWHLTLQDWSKAALEAGFVMRRLVEPRPVKEVPRVYSGLKKVNRVPHSLILECVREGVSTVGWAGIGH
jgi:SAM-dependent methyltransferase